MTHDPVLNCRIRLDCNPGTGSCSTLIVTRPVILKQVQMPLGLLNSRKKYLPGRIWGGNAAYEKP